MAACEPSYSCVLPFNHLHNRPKHSHRQGKGLKRSAAPRMKLAVPRADHNRRRLQRQPEPVE